MNAELAQLKKGILEGNMNVVLREIYEVVWKYSVELNKNVDSLTKLCENNRASTATFANMKDIIEALKGLSSRHCIKA